jgi:hypothetical protein
MSRQEDPEMSNDPYDPPLAQPSAGWPGLDPVSIVALGTPHRPPDRALGLQSATYRLVLRLARLRLPKLPSIRTVADGTQRRPADS